MNRATERVIVRLIRVRFADRVRDSPGWFSSSRGDDVAINRSFGDAGLLWSAVPRDLHRYSPAYDPDQRYLGGRATGVVVDGTGPLLTCWGWSPDRFTEKAEVGIITMGADGAPAVEFGWPGTSYTRISDDGWYAVPLASCAGLG